MVDGGVDALRFSNRSEHRESLLHTNGPEGEGGRLERPDRAGARLERGERPTAPFAIDLVSVLVSLLAILFGVGQLCLIRRIPQPIASQRGRRGAPA